MGQPFVTASNYGPYDIYRGGEIRGISATAKVYWREWFPEIFEAIPQSSWENGQCESIVSTAPMDAVNIVVEDVSTYGMSLLGNGKIGFASKLTIKVNYSDVISCSGFESCSSP